MTSKHDEMNREGERSEGEAGRDGGKKIFTIKSINKRKPCDAHFEFSSPFSVLCSLLQFRLLFCLSLLFFSSFFPQLLLLLLLLLVAFLIKNQ